MPRVHMPDGKIVNFPDGMSEQDMSKAMDEIHGPSQQAAAPEEKSVGGFLGNVVSSGGQFLGDTAKGLYSLAKLAGDVMPAGLANNPERVQERAGEAKQLVANAPRIASVAGQALKNRYGGIEQIKNTLYNDPVGVLGDVATVADGVGLASKAGGASKIARIAEGVSEAANPIRLIAEPTAKAIEYGTAAAVRPMLKPSKMLRRQQDSALEIERAALKNGAVTEGLADAQRKQSVARANAAADAASQPIARDSITPMPKALGSVEKGLDHEGDLNALAKVEGEVAGSLPSEISPRDLLDKRRYLDRELNNAFRAADRGGAPTGIRQTGQQEILGNIRGALRKAAPGLREADDQTRQLGLVQAALGDAGLRAGDLPMGAALAGLGTAAAGIPGAGMVGGGFALGRMFPQVPLALGSIPVMGSAALANASKVAEGRRAALVARLMAED